MSRPEISLVSGESEAPLGTDVNGTWLLFDAQCSTCSRISRELEEATEGKLAVLPLDSDFALQARRQVFGISPPHKPTLLKVTDGEPRAWIGARIAPLVAREVGVESSLRILKALGIERSGKQSRDHDGADAKLLSRRGFAQVAGGIAATFGILAAGSFTGVRPAAASENTVKSMVNGSQSRARELIEAALENTDFLDIADTKTVDAMRTRELTGSPDLSKSQFQLHAENFTSREYVKAAPIVQVTAKTYKDGDTVETLGIAVEESGLMYIVDFIGTDQRIQATRYAIDAEAGELEVVDASANGIRLEPVPDGVTAQAKAKDPCGGCASATKMFLGPSCKTKKPVQCVLSGAGCGACIASCTAVNAACILCVASSCGGALMTCCEKVGSGACFPCGAKP